MKAQLSFCCYDSGISSVCCNNWEDGLDQITCTGTPGQVSINPLSQLAGAPTPAMVSSVCCATQSFQMVFYVDDNGNIIQLIYNNGWGFHNLTQWAKAPACPATSALCCYKDGSSVFYITSDQNIQQLAYSPSTGWTHNNLTQIVNNNRPAVNSSMCCTNSGDFQMVFYLDEIGGVNQLIYSNGWGSNILTGDLPKASPDSTLCCYDDGSSVFYIAPSYPTNDLHLFQLVYNQIWWCYDLCQKTGSPNASVLNSICCTNSGSNQMVIYMDNNSHIIQLVYGPNGWGFYDLTTWSKAPVIPPDCGTICCTADGSTVYAAINAVLYIHFNGQNWQYWTEG